MAGGGGSSYFPRQRVKFRRLVEKTVEETELRGLDAEVGDYLQTVLAKVNERQSDKVQRYIDEIAQILGGDQEIEKFLFGGSVAKHTFVDGLSDIDALVILNRAGLEGKTPVEVLRDFFDSLDASLLRDKVQKVSVGKLAVTVSYEDGIELQLLPAIRRGDSVCISDADGGSWKTINPKVFQRDLTKANERLNNALVPAIKLAKSLLSDLPAEIRPTGYHVEALSVEATKGYRGPKTVKSLLQHILTASISRVREPVADTTSQSRHIDANLGKKNSQQREKLSLAIAAIARRMNAASTVDRWKEIIGF